PIISRSSVDLPEPDPPRMTSVSPWRTSRLILFRTVRVPKTLVTSRTWIATPLMRSKDGAGACRPESDRRSEVFAWNGRVRTFGPIGPARPGSVPYVNDRVHLLPTTPARKTPT